MTRANCSTSRFAAATGLRRAVDNLLGDAAGCANPIDRAGNAASDSAGEKRAAVAPAGAGRGLTRRAANEPCRKAADEIAAERPKMRPDTSPLVTNGDLGHSLARHAFDD